MSVELEDLRAPSVKLGEPILHKFISWMHVVENSLMSSEDADCIITKF